MSYWPENAFAEWCPVVGTPVWKSISLVQPGTRIGGGASGREALAGVGAAEDEFFQNLSAPGGTLQFIYRGNGAAAAYLLTSCSRVTTTGYPHTALPIFGVQGGINVANGWSKQIACVCNKLELSIDRPRGPVMAQIDYLTSNHARQSGTATPAAATATEKTFRDSLVTVKVGAGSHTAMKCQSIRVSLENNAEPDASLDEFTSVVAGDEYFFPGGFLPGDEIVRVSVSLATPIHYDAFMGDAWTAYEVVWEITDGTLVQGLTLGPLYLDEDSAIALSNAPGRYIWGYDLVSKRNTSAWAFDDAVT